MNRISLLIIVILIAIGMSSCRLFRKKNKCDTCPSWKAEIEQIDLKESKA